ncbi:hypothetical protein CR155_02275 [Pollutimonas nitritireducens]|uniref:MobA-like NTP transferase domain-containing protein n=1 Tax=Pollutimonas nitritireducens TaxID=2045209 RepID=A0A2N4ULK0_9BURK|nr:hypothetical protein CR155_02275 [Pollutimonas nitritireducens]
MHLSSDTGAATVVRNRRSSGAVLDLPLDDMGIVMDVDTMEDLANAEALLRARSQPNEREANGNY